MKVAVLVLSIVGVVTSFVIGACTGACIGTIGDFEKEVIGDAAAGEKTAEMGIEFFGWEILQSIIGLLGGIYAFVKFDHKTKGRIAGIVILVAAAISIHNTFQFLTAGILFAVAGLLAMIGAGRSSQAAPKATQ